MLRRLILHNFRSIASASIDFSQFTFLVGRNGSGKSNIADALAFMAEVAEWPLQTVFNRRGGALSVARRRPLRAERLSAAPIEFGIGIEFEDLPTPWARNPSEGRSSVRYAFLISILRHGFEVIREQCIVTDASGKRAWFDRTGQKISSSVEYLSGDGLTFVSRDALAIPFLSGTVDLHVAGLALKSIAVYSIEPGKLREFQDPDSGNRLLPDGRNAASVLAEIPQGSAEFRRLFEILSTVIPDFERVRPHTIGRKQQLRFVQRWSPEESLLFDAFNMSDGTLRAFGILLALYQNQRPNLLVIEEPEASLHPAATAAIVETLRQESVRSQIVITTHSPEVLDLAHPGEDNFKVVTWHGGQTKVANVIGAARSALQQHLCSAGELLRMRILDAAPLFDDFEEDKQQKLFEDIQ
jgi:predicted ATPase